MDAEASPLLPEAEAMLQMLQQTTTSTSGSYPRTCLEIEDDWFMDYERHKREAAITGALPLHT